jgi:hypothetical protein
MWPRTTTKTSSLRQRALREGYRSGLELKAAAQLNAAGVTVAYEEEVIEYTVPEQRKKYKIDFRLPNGILVETKGRFVSDDRKKHKLVREQYPDLDLRIVFQNPNARIGKKSTTTYAQWCDKLGIKWAKAEHREAPIPAAWLNEKTK